MLYAAVGVPAAAVALLSICFPACCSRSLCNVWPPISDLCWLLCKTTLSCFLSSLIVVDAASMLIWCEALYSSLPAFHALSWYAPCCLILACCSNHCLLSVSLPLIQLQSLVCVLASREVVKCREFAVKYNYFLGIMLQNPLKRSNWSQSWARQYCGGSIGTTQ